MHPSHVLMHAQRWHVSFCIRLTSQCVNIPLQGWEEGQAGCAAEEGDEGEEERRRIESAAPQQVQEGEKAQAAVAC